jgi:hypothetical protein
MLLTLLFVFSQNTSISMQFAKMDSLSKNPNTGQQTIYKTNVKDRIVQDFKEKPVYIVNYTNSGEQIIQIGKANCVYSDGKWLTATLTVSKEIPTNYVLRAIFVHNDSKTVDKVEEVYKASITEFVFKPKEKATIFE